MGVDRQKGIELGKEQSGASVGAAGERTRKRGAGRLPHRLNSKPCVALVSCLACLSHPGKLPVFVWLWQKLIGFVAPFSRALWPQLVMLQ